MIAGLPFGVLAGGPRIVNTFLLTDGFVQGGTRTVPSNVTPGSLLLASVFAVNDPSGGSTPSISAPPGWTLANTETRSFTAPFPTRNVRWRRSLFYIIDNGLAGSTVTFATSANSTFYVGLGGAIYSKSITTIASPFDVGFVGTQSEVTPARTSWSVLATGGKPSITPTPTNLYLTSSQNPLEFVASESSGLPSFTVSGTATNSLVNIAVLDLSF
jgi:hypothetical protein